MMQFCYQISVVVSVTVKGPVKSRNQNCICMICPPLHQLSAAAFSVKKTCFGRSVFVPRGEAVTIHANIFFSSTTRIFLIHLRQSSIFGRHNNESNYFLTGKKSLMARVYGNYVIRHTEKTISAVGASQGVHLLIGKPPRSFTWDTGCQ